MLALSLEWCVGLCPSIEMTEDIKRGGTENREEGRCEQPKVQAEWGSSLCQLHQREDAGLLGSGSESHTWVRRHTGSWRRHILWVAKEWKTLQALPLKPNVRNINCLVRERYRSWKLDAEMTTYLFYEAQNPEATIVHSHALSTLYPVHLVQEDICLLRTILEVASRMPQNSGVEREGGRIKNKNQLLW